MTTTTNHKIPVVVEIHYSRHKTTNHKTTNHKTTNHLPLTPSQPNHCPSSASPLLVIVVKKDVYEQIERMTDG